MLTSQRLDGNIGLNKIEREIASVLLKAVIGNVELQYFLVTSGLRLNLFQVDEVAF